MPMRQRGVSLMEAVVALAVMGFGMLGVAAMQSSLRANADIARQRAEAVRLAQEALESYRTYSVVATTAGKVAFDDISTPAATEIAGTNATYTRSLTVSATGSFNVKTVQVAVDWVDRGNAAQQVLLASQIHRTPPELAGALIAEPSGVLYSYVAGSSGGMRSGTSGSSKAPPSSDDLGNGTSSYSPPGGGSVRWIFSNSTGLVTSICSSPLVCTSITGGRLVQGYVSFALTAGAGPGSPESEEPNDLAPGPIVGSLAVNVSQTAPAGAPTHSCFYQFVPTPSVKTIGFNCLIRVTASAGSNSLWSGGVTLSFPNLATSDSDISGSSYRVCRYTRYRNDQVVGTIESETGLTISNADHPKLYSAVGVNLLNQNFLVIRAGNGSAPYSCPDDDSSTPEAYGRTWQHQPTV